MPSKQVHILWEGTLLTNHSFGLVNRAHCQNLLEWDAVDLSLIPHEPDQFQPAAGSRLERLMKHDIRKKGLNLRERSKRPHVWIRHTWPPKPKPPGRDRWIAMLPWEYSLLPINHVKTLEGASEIWTPSTFSATALRNSGIEAPVHVIPNGVDVGVFNPDGAPHALANEDVFTFLYVGGTIYRKGVDLLLKAYAEAFSRSDNVRLVIKDSGTRNLYLGQTAGSMVRKYQENEDVAEIVYLEDDLSQVTLSALYRSSDVLVSPYRGEGFSLPTLEAMACGTPPMVTSGGATDDFVDERSGWHIPSHRISVGNTIYGEELRGEGFLLEPDVERLGTMMRNVVSARKEVADKGLRASRSAAEWTWTRATLALLRRIDVLCDTHIVTQVEERLATKQDNK